MCRRWLAALILMLIVAAPAAAGNWLDWLRGHFNPRVCPPLPCCPDDYCKKPPPWLPCLPPCTGADDYCKKPYPFIPCLPRCGGPDDYCCKPLPCLVCPPWSPYLSCGVPAAAPASCPAPVRPH
jgi:hypothetical protein